MLATWLMPRAKPRWPAGNASVKTAGPAISTMDPFIVDISTAAVVFDSATRL
jgi:hypothetical protein